MRYLLHAAAACALAPLLAACSGAPSENTPDYEIAAVRQNPPSSSGGSATNEGTPSNVGSSEGESHAEAGASTSSSGQPSPKGSTVAVAVDDTQLTVGSANIWSEVSKAGDYDLFVKVTGAGVEAGSDFHVKATKVAAGCADGNYIDFRPANDTQYMAKRGDAACGLSVDEIPTAVGGHFRGSFHGTLESINVTPAKTKRVVFTFDVVRTK